MSLKAPFPYIGTKRGELLTIQYYQPEQFNKMIDAFGGGGSVALHYLQTSDVSIVYNDLCKSCAEVFKILKRPDHTRVLVDRMKTIEPTQENYTEFRKSYLTNPFSLMFTCTYGFMSCPANSKVRLRTENGRQLTAKIKEFDYMLEYPDVLGTDRFAVTNSNGLDLLEQYKSDPNAFIYLDPPYAATDTRSYICEDTHGLLPKIYKYMSDPETKCKILLHIDFNGETYSMFQSLTKCFYPVKYKVFGRNGRRSTARYLMVVTNYETPTEI